MIDPIRAQPEPAGLSVESGMIPMEYADVDSGARIVCEPSEDRPSTGCWVVCNSRHISPLKEFPTAEAAYHALRAAIAADRAQRQPVPPEHGEVQELVRVLHQAADNDEWDGASPEWCASLTRAADLLAQRYPQPVPVSERLPGPEDCDAEGRCWCFTPRLVFEGQLIFHSRWILSVPMEADTHWLPAPALPLPVEVEE